MTTLEDVWTRPATRPEELLDSLRWRYAVKRFDSSRPLSEERWRALEEALVLSPSSYGLQPWKFIVVDDPALRARLKPVSWNQGQITDAAKLVVFAGRKDLGPRDVQRLIDRMGEVRAASPDQLLGYREMMLSSIANRSAAELQAWVARQVYIALGVFLTSAAVMGVDACPMEGIDAARYDDMLGLSGTGYTVLCVAAAGYRADDDSYAEQPKVRYPRTEVIEQV